MRGLASIASAILLRAGSLDSFYSHRSIILFLLIGFFFKPVCSYSQHTDIPDYSHERAVPRGSAGISSLNNIIISLDTDSSGNLYVLTFGGRIYKYDAVGQLQQSFIINKLESPVDIAINSR